MNVPFLDLKRQYQDIKDEVTEKVSEILESGNYIMGSEVLGLESELCEYLNVKNSITCGNGTDALVIALRAIGIKEFDEVITTPFTFFATSEAIASVGAIHVFVDVLEDSYNINHDKIEEKITEKTKAIVPVHIFGYPANMDKINLIAKKYNLKVIEDCCQAIGSEYKNIKVGGCGDIACFSFFPTKNLGAAGDGGLITTNDDNLATVCRALREHGGGQVGMLAKSILDGNDNNEVKIEQVNAQYNPYKYFNYLIGYNSRLDAIQAGILRIKLKKLDEYNAKRKNNALIYNEKLGALMDFKVPQECSYGKHVWHQYAFRTKYKVELTNYLISKGITVANFYPVPLHLQKAFSYLNYEVGSLKIAEQLSNEMVCLPIFPELEYGEIEYISNLIKEFVLKK